MTNDDRAELCRGRIRILVVAHELTATGAPRLLLQVCAELSKHHAIKVIARDGGQLRESLEATADVVILSPPPRPPGAPITIRHATAVARAIVRRGWTFRLARRWRPDAIYVNSAYALPEVAAMKVRGVPTILHVHEAAVALADLEAQFPRLISTVPDRYVAVSRSVAEELSRAYGVESAQIAVIPPGLELPATPRAVRRIGSSGIEFVVGGIGNPSWFKGHVLWLLVAREVLRLMGETALRFVWVGVRDNAEARHFRAMVSKLGLERVVDLRAEVRDASDELRSFDVLAVTSWEESASLATLEAMAHGVPVVCFAGSGGPAELLGDTGIVIPEFAPGAMAEALVRMHRDRGARERLAAAARDRAAHNYDAHEVTSRVVREIDAAIEVRSP